MGEFDREQAENMPSELIHVAGEVLCVHVDRPMHYLKDIPMNKEDRRKVGIICITRVIALFMRDRGVDITKENMSFLMEEIGDTVKLGTEDPKTGKVSWE